MNVRLIARRLKYAAILIVLPFLVNAQLRTVTGTVTSDKDGSAISGATVVAKGAKSTQTSADGNFTIQVPDATKKITVSSVGFGSGDFNIGADNKASVVLKAGGEGLTEVVVIGYGGSRKRDLTGAVATLKAKDFNVGVITNPDQLFQGKIAGLQVTSNNGQPGAATTVRIRGYSSLRPGTGQPLYVLDGIPLDGRTARPGFSIGGLGSTPEVNPLLFINPNDIASIEVLKDASSAAIFGSRGANGVILITTKKGVSGQPKLDFSYSLGTSKQFRKYKVANADEYRGLLKTYNVTATDLGANTDAQSEILRSAVSQNLGLSVSGGGENNNYRLSLNYQDNQGIIKNSGLKKYIATFKGQSKFLDTKKLNLDYYVSMSRTQENIVPVTNDAGFTGSLMSGAIGWNPTTPLTKPDGSFNQLGVNALVNPLALLAYYNDQVNITNLFGYFSPSYKFNNNFEYKATIGINSQSGVRRTSEDSALATAGIKGRGIAYYANNELNTLLFNQTLTYNQKITSKLNLNALVGYEYQKFSYRGVSIAGQDFQSNIPGYTNILQNASQSSLSVASFNDPSSELQSYFGRTTLNYDDKYLITGTIRADGSNKFGSNNKYGYFPSFAARWNVSNENFMGSIKSLSNVALRLGYGITGSQEFPAGSSQDQYRFGQQSLGLSNYANKDLKWEKTKQFNIGVDMVVVKRVNFSIDYFNKNTSDLIFNNPVPLPGPAVKYWVNSPGNITNKGLELKIDAVVIEKGDFSVNVGFNAAFIKNEIKNLPPGNITTGVVSGNGLSGATAQKLANNQPILSFFMLDFVGLNSSGFATYKDDSGTPKTADATQYFVGSPIPKTTLGINLDVTYKKLTLSASMYGAYGHKVFNNTALAVLPISKLGSYNVDSRFLLPGENTGNGLAASTRYLEKGNYLKMANMTLRYNAGNISMLKNLSLFVTGQNLFWITKYKGVDPEVNTDKQKDGVSSFGLEYTPYPSARTFQVGFNVSL
jgi:TonB-dependent starch-binding outer membrane protein SusC